MSDTRRTVAALITVAVLALNACSARGASVDSPPDPPAESAPAASSAHEVTIVGRDYTFEAPDEIPSGLTAFTFRNEGAVVHHVQVVRLNDGVTFQQLMEAFMQGEAAAFPLFTPMGGASLIDPGAAGRVTLNLEPGAYALLCLVPDEQGIPHLAHGMARPLAVTGDTTAASQPEANLTVSMADFQYTMPSEVEAGPQTWKIVNDGPQPHELVLHKLAPGKSADDVIAFIHQPEGPPPFTNAGGMQGLPQGGAGWVHLDLEPGTYVAICYIPDPASGAPHLDLGMVKAFTVVSS